MGLLRSILTAPDGLTTTSSRLSCWVKSGLFSTTLTVSNFRMSRHTVSDAALRSVTSDKFLCRVSQRACGVRNSEHPNLNGIPTFSHRQWTRNIHQTGALSMDSTSRIHERSILTLLLFYLIGRL